MHATFNPFNRIARFLFSSSFSSSSFSFSLFLSSSLLSLLLCSSSLPLLSLPTPSSLTLTLTLTLVSLFHSHSHFCSHSCFRCTIHVRSIISSNASFSLSFNRYLGPSFSLPCMHTKNATICFHGRAWSTMLARSMYTCNSWYLVCAASVLMASMQMKYLTFLFVIHWQCSIISSIPFQTTATNSSLFSSGLVTKSNKSSWFNPSKCVFHPIVSNYGTNSLPFFLLWIFFCLFFLIFFWFFSNNCNSWVIASFDDGGTFSLSLFFISILK